MDKEDMVHTHTMEYYSTIENNEDFAIFNNMDESGG